MRRGQLGRVPAGEGWFHEDFHLPDKDAAFARARDGGRIGADDLVAATRVYTPGPIVEFLLQNTLGAMWLAMHPGSPLRARWTRIVPEAVGPARPPRPVATLRVVDPCCGAGGFLLEAARMLLQMAHDEARMAGVRMSDADIARVVAPCVWGGDLDAEAVAIARRELRGLVPAAATGCVRVLDGPLGSLAPDVWDDRRWDVVVTNPPWVGSRLLAPDLRERLRDAGAGAVSDLAVAVQRRCWTMTAATGRCGTITPAGWLNDRGADDLRRDVLADGGPRVVVRMGQGVFAQAPLVFCAMSVLERGGPSDGWPVLAPRAGVRGVDAPLVTVGRGVARPIGGSVPFAPSIPATVMLGGDPRPTVGDHFTSFDGVWTGDNARDVRHWWELGDADAGWARLSGGQGRDGWVSATRLRIRGEAVWGQPGRVGALEYPRVAGGFLCARLTDPGAAALAGVVTLVPRDGEGERRLAEVLALFNSRLGTAWLRTLTSGLNFNPGYAARIPLGAAMPSDDLTAAVRALCDLRAEALRRDPSADVFTHVPAPWQPDDLAERIASCEALVDARLRVHLAISVADWEAMAPAPVPRRQGSTAEDHMMVAALRVLGMRWPTDGGVVRPVRMRIGRLADAVADCMITASAPADVVDGARTWIVRSFVTYHARRFRRRPIVTVDDGWVRPVAPG